MLVDESGNRHIEELVVNVDGQETLLVIIFDAVCELAGEDGCDWVLVRQIQADTSLRLGRLEELLEEWESMGVVRRDDTRLWVAFCPSVADNLSEWPGAWMTRTNREVKFKIIQKLAGSFLFFEISTAPAQG